MDLQRSHARGRVASVNTGVPQVLRDHSGRQWTTAIEKHPVPGRVRVHGVNVEGDDQADRRVHGGADKAVYAYATADAGWWAAGLGRQLQPGAFGENLTVDDLDVSGAVLGERWRVGTTLLEVTQPRIPCAKLGVAMGDLRFPRNFAEAGRPGAHLRIVEAGELGAGDLVEVVSVPQHGVTVGDVLRVHHRFDRDVAQRMVGIPGLVPKWRTWALERLAS